MKGLRIVHLGPLDPTDTSIPDLLCKMAELPVEEITLYVAFELIGDFKPMDFCGLNTSFAPPAFPSLKYVSCVYAGTLAPKKVRDRMKQVLPALAARGIELDCLKLIPVLTMPLE